MHCAGTSKGDEDKTLNLVRAASRAGARHLVYISVVGADRVPVASGVDRAMFAYFASKLAAERVGPSPTCPGRPAGHPVSRVILTRARQMARLPVVPVPPGSGSSRSTPTRWRTGSPSWPSAGRPDWCPTWPGRGCTRWPRCSASTCGPAASAGRSSRSGSRARPPGPSGPGPTWPPTEPWADGPGEEFLADQVAGRATGGTVGEAHRAGG